jgi:hypothetical protein
MCSTGISTAVCIFLAEGLLSFTPFTACAQEIRPVARPNEAVRVAHGGYVCEGRATITPIDDSYDTVSCSGPMYNSADYVALYTKLNYDELVKMNSNAQEAINRDLKAAIQRRFSELPPNLREMAAIQNLEKSLSEYVDERLPQGRGAGSPHPTHSSTSTSHSSSP